ncbi:MAG: HNH endonuclease [Raoultibacter sp.]
MLDKGTQARSDGDIALMGMPHVGAYYAKGYSNKKRRYAADRDAICPFCGKPATEVHHVVETGMGGHQLPVNVYTEWGTFPLFSPLWAVCGFGNCSGCHGCLLSGISVVWVWDDDESEEIHRTGYLWTICEPHSSLLWEMGHYEIKQGGRTIRELRNGRCTDVHPQ